MTTNASRPPVTPDRPTAARPRPASGGGGSVAARIDPIRVLRQNQWKLAFGAGLGLVTGAVLTVAFSFLYPLYSGQVVFELRPGLADAREVVSQDTRSEEAVERIGQTEAGRITSRNVLQKAMQSRDIEETEWSRSRRLRDENGRFLVDEAVDELEKDLRAGHRRRTQYFTLGWSSHVASDVPVVLNGISRAYLEVRRAQDDARFAQNLSVYNEQKQNTDNQLTSLANEIGQFIKDRNITSLNEMANDAYLALEDTGRRLNEVKGQFSMMQSRKSVTEDKLEGKLEPTSEDVRTAEDDPVVMRVNGDLRQLSMSAEVVKNKFGENHPAYRDALKQFAAAESERRALLKEIIERNLTADFKSYSDQVESLAQLQTRFTEDYNKQELRLRDFAANMSQLEQLKDQRARLQEQRSRLLDLINDLNSLKIREDAKAVSVAQPATTPRERSFPQWKVMLPLGGLLGMLLVAGFAFLREFMDQRVRYTSDLAGIPARLLGIVPDATEDPTGVKNVEFVIRDRPESVLAETARQMAAHVQKQMLHGGHRTLMVASGLPEAGTTTMATNLAAAFAAGDRRTLLLDANFRRPAVARVSGLDPDSVGFGDALAGTASLEAAIRNVSPRLDVLPAGTPASRVVERLGTARVDEIFRELKERYDVIVVDAPPSVVAGDALVLAAKVDATMMVVRAFQEQRGLVSRMVHQLSDMPSAFLGLVLNRPRMTAGGYFRKNYEAMAKYSAAPGAGGSAAA
jgi:capsular exopolysaccharide synthesis family protein